MKQAPIDLMPDSIRARSQAGAVVRRYVIAMLLGAAVLIAPATHARLMLRNATMHRDEAAKGVETTLLKRYDRVVKMRGIAVVPLKGDDCGGCHMSLPPQLVNTILRHESIEACPQCHRLLYNDAMLEEAADKPA